MKNKLSRILYKIEDFAKNLEDLMFNLAGNAAFRLLCAVISLAITLTIGCIIIAKIILLLSKSLS